MTSVPAQRADAEAILLGPRLSALRLLHDEGVVSDPDVCTAYVIVWLEARHGPGKWLGGKRKLAPALTRSGAVCEGDSYKSIDFDSLVAGGVLHPPPVKSLQRLRLHEASTLREALERAQFLTLPEYAAVSLLNWYAGFRPLRLLWRIPSADELLDMQAVGERCVSALTSDKALRTTFGHRDCMEMLVHDLQHAERFMGGDQYWQQVGFFAFLRSSVAPLHATHLADSCGQRWRLAWQYVSSDMNAAAVHLLMTLKCQLAGAIARRTLQEQGLDVPGEAEEDIKLAAMKGDIYPKAVAGPWREALRSAGLVDAYMTAFADEWSVVVSAHMAEVSRRFPAAFEENSLGCDEQGKSRDEAAVRLTFAVVSEALHAVGSAFTDSPATGQEAVPETACYGRHACVLTAHFDDFGRRSRAFDHLCHT